MGVLKTMRTPVEDALIAEAAKLAVANDNSSSLRAQGLQQLQQLCLPHRRIEEWKYTDLRAVWREPLSLARKPDQTLVDAASKLAPKPDLPSLTFVNGFLTDTSQLPKGVEVISLEQERNCGVLCKALNGWSDPALALNSAFLQSGAVVRVAKGTKLNKPLHLDLRNVGAPSASYPRIVVLIEEGAQALFLETHAGDQQTYASNGVVIFVCAKDVKVEHVRVQVQGLKTINVLSTVADLGENVQFKSFSLEEGALLSRNQYFIRQTGENVQISLSGVSLAKGKQHLDTTLVVDHAVPHGISREVFKQVIVDEARGVFQGKVIVRPGAQKTDGHMNARGLLLSDRAEFDAKPELEIYADDVLCAHGATAGALDENLLFYLRARGIIESEAKSLLTQAFIGEAVEKIEFEPLREAVMARATAWLKENMS
jgi:Fe-S cluster assembly protein SufD